MSDVTANEQEERRQKAEAVNRYDRACHAVQSGVAMEQSRGSDDGSPKHLRVGVKPQ